MISLLRPVHYPVPKVRCPLALSVATNQLPQQEMQEKLWEDSFKCHEYLKCFKV